MAKTISNEKKPTKDANTPISKGCSALVVGICRALHQNQLFSSLGYAALCRGNTRSAVGFSRMII